MDRHAHVVGHPAATGAPLIEKLGLPTEMGRLKVTTDLQVPDHPDVFAAGDAAAVPDVTQPPKITPPTAQHATRQGKVLALNVAASLGYGKKKLYKHRNMGLVVDLGPHYAVANPLNVQLSGYAAKFVTRVYHLYAIPRFVNRWAVSLAYLTDVFFDRSVVSIGLSSSGGGRRAPLPQPEHSHAEGGLISPCCVTFHLPIGGAWVDRFAGLAIVHFDGSGAEPVVVVQEGRGLGRSAAAPPFQTGWLGLAERESPRPTGLIPVMKMLRRSMSGTALQNIDLRQTARNSLLAT